MCEEYPPLFQREDVVRYNAVDKIAGYLYLHGIKSDDKLFFTTGWLTSEMLLKTAQMGIRPGYTVGAVELARQIRLTLPNCSRRERVATLSGLSGIVVGAQGSAHNE